jgi:hypothetical protein
MSVDRTAEIRKRKLLKCLREDQSDIVTELFNRKIHQELPKLERY